MTRQFMRLPRQAVFLANMHPLVSAASAKAFTSGTLARLTVIFTRCDVSSHGFQQAKRLFSEREAIEASI